jgi:hypothetical protein
LAAAIAYLQPPSLPPLGKPVKSNWPVSDFGRRFALMGGFVRENKNTPPMI